MGEPTSVTRDDSGRLAALVVQVAAKDARAFADLYALTRNKMRKTARSVGLSTAEIDDVLQDAYLKIWNNADKFDAGRASAITWMSAIVRNTAIDAVRVVRVPVTELDEALAVPQSDSGDADEFDYDWAKPIATRALERLPHSRRTLVALAYLEGVSRASLSQRYGVPVNTIKTWLRRAIESVRKDCLQSVEA